MAAVACIACRHTKPMRRVRARACLRVAALPFPADDDSLVRGEEKLPGDAFALSVRNIWEVIRSQKDLNLPAHKVGRDP